MSTVYKLHRRINAPLEFQGLKAQYIFYAIALVVGDMLLFTLLYLIGVNNYICLALCFGIGVAGIGCLYHRSSRYGEYGWRRRRAARPVPRVLRSASRGCYRELKK